ncbi:MAG: ligand-binding sensor domain-containing protein [Saprospiraceae bacterium]|jgi:ligand-binding sensor domain-containing protein
MKNLLAILFCCFICAVNAQEWVNFTNGLDVNDMVQDGDVLWIATSGGLVKRDLDTGENKYFTRGDSPIPSNFVRSLALDLDHNLWLSTNAGTAIFDGTNWTVFYDKSGLLHLANDGRMIIAEIGKISWWDGQDFESVETNLSYDFQVGDIIVDPVNDDIWLTYNTYGVFHLFRYNDEGFTLFNYENTPLPLESSTNNPLLLDKQDRLWVGTYYGLFRKTADDWVDFSTDINGFPDGRIAAIGMSDNENIWVIITNWENGGWNSLLVEIAADDSFTISNFPESIARKSEFNFLKFLPSAAPSMYIGTEDAGLGEYDLSSWYEVPTSQSKLGRNSIREIFIDCETVYISAGLNYGDIYNNTQFAIKEGEWIFTKKEDLPAALNDTWRVEIVDKSIDGSIWVHVEDSLYSLKDGNWSVPSFPDIMEGVEEVNSLIYHEPSGGRWLLETYNALLFHETTDGWYIFNRFRHGALGGNYNAYFTHPQTGDFWLASANGISRYDRQEWSIIKPDDFDDIYTDGVEDMKVDDNGIVWALTRNGILKIQDTVPEVFVTDIPGSENYRFNSFTFDQQHRLWVGLNSAIAVFDEGEWILFDNKNSGIPNGAINELHFDAAGNLWIGSGSGGLAIYNEKGLPEYLLSDSPLLPDSLQVAEDISFTVSPNPGLRNAALNFTISNSFKLDDTSKLIIYNSLGQRIKDILICNRDMKVSLEPIGLTPGVYFFQVRNETHATTQKVIVH